MGKFVFSGFVPIGNSVIIAPPFSIIALHSFLFSAGYILSNPLPKTAIVLPFAIRLPICEYVSIPLAKPLIMFIPFFDNSDKLTGKRIYDFLDNRKLICDYLTSKVFRLVEPHEPGKNDSNKSRRDLCAFWKALRSCKLTDTFIPEEDRSLVRTYTRKLNSEVVKSRAVKAAITYGIYVRGINADDPLTDCIEALCMLNDNDLHDAYNYKTKKVRQFNANELMDTMENAVKRSSNLMLIDKDTGDIIFNS